jgi:cytochrome o ubiquinol oxidase subunit 3
MYVRSFKPPPGSAQRTWFSQEPLHVVALLAALLLSLKATSGLVHAFRSRRPNLGAAFGHFLRPSSCRWSDSLASASAPASGLPAPRGPVDFTEANAIDVESMGLYWHFVDIVWIVIFTAVYLLEYL